MNKYGAKKADCLHGHVHDSIKEAKRCNELHLLARAGQISDLQVQPQFWFVIDGRQVKHDNGRRVGYKADFKYFTKDGCVVEDVKPKSKLAISRDYPLRIAIFKALYPSIIFLEVVDGGKNYRRRMGKTK